MSRLFLIVVLWALPNTVLAADCGRRLAFPNSGRDLVVEGTTTCASGRIFIRAYEGEEYLGNASGFVRGHTFEALIFGANAEDLSIKYVIE